jgi:hypothetical protein
LKWWRGTIIFNVKIRLYVGLNFLKPMGLLDFLIFEYNNNSMCNNYLQKRFFHIIIISLCFITKQLQSFKEQMFVARYTTHKLVYE